MNIIELNITGIILLISFMIFIIRNYSNNKYSDITFNDVKMKVKISKESSTTVNYNSSATNTNNIKNNNQNFNNLSSTTKNNQQNVNTNKLLFIKLYTPNILSDPRIFYIGDSFDANTVYAILSEDTKYLTDGRYKIIENISREVPNGEIYTQQSQISKIIDEITKRKYNSKI